MEIRYAHSGETNIAYQVVGSGPIDIVMSPGWITHLELAWDVPRLRDSTVAWVRSRASSCSTSAASACPTACPT